MGNIIIYGLLAIAASAAVYFMVENAALTGELAVAQFELKKAQDQVAVLQKRQETMQKSNKALEQLAQSCFDREKAARADAELWLQTLADMELREITDTEKKEVPDDKTRRALLNDLDEPL